MMSGIVAALAQFVLAASGHLKELLPEKKAAKLLRQRWVVFTATFLLAGLFAYDVAEQKAAAQREAWRKTQEKGVLRSQDTAGEADGLLVLGNAKFGGPGFAFGSDKVRVDMKDGRAVVTAIIRDRNKNVVASIVDNHWLIAPPPWEMDRNYTQDTLEILDRKGAPILQVKVVANEVHFASVSNAAGNAVTVNMGPFLHEIEGRGETLFRYPSWKYPGQLNPATKKVIGSK